MKSTLRIALIPGDGIGLETVPAAVRVLDTAARAHGLDLSYESFDWGCDYFVEHGAMMPPDGLGTLSKFDAIFLGAVGRPDVPDHVSLWGLLIPIRRNFQQYVNLRPIRAFEGIEIPLRDRQAAEIDFVVVRENNEGEYSNVGGRLAAGTEEELAIQVASFSRTGIRRIARYAATIASSRRGLLASATKSNGIVHTLPFWDDVVRGELQGYSDVELTEFHIDALCAQLVTKPQTIDVIVASNLFGDILSDLCAALAGGLGIAPSANLNPEGRFPSMFEPVHGSAPDIMGKGIANPIGQIWSGAMMLHHLGHVDAAASIDDAIAGLFATRAIRTPDLGGSATTGELTDAIVELMSG